MKLLPYVFLSASLVFFGGNAMAQADNPAKPMNVDINTGDINLRIKMNGDGGIDVIAEGLKPSEGKLTPAESMEALGVISVFMYGGAIDKGDFHMHTDGYMKKYLDCMSTFHDKQMQDEFLRRYMDNVKVTSVDELIRLLKQASWNRDKAAGQPAAEPTPPTAPVQPTPPKKPLVY